MEANRKRRALELLAKLEQGAYNPESNVYSMAALVIAGALGKPYKNPREPDTEKAALAAMYAYSADVHALADYVKELEQQAAAARRTVMAAKHQIAMNRIDRLREYSPEAADEWKPPRD